MLKPFVCVCVFIYLYQGVSDIFKDVNLDIFKVTSIMWHKKHWGNFLALEIAPWIMTAANKSPYCPLISPMGIYKCHL